MLDIEDDSVCVVAYVEDRLPFGIKNFIFKVKDKLASYLKITDFGQCRQFIGINIERRKTGLMLNQTAYINRILDAANMINCKPTKTALTMAHPPFEKCTDWTDSKRSQM